jgi:hypothetical protein
MQNFGIRVLLSASYILAVVAIASAIVLTLKGDATIDASWTVAFVPVWLEIVLVLGLTLFLYPGFLDQTISMHREAFLLLFYIGCLAITTSLVALKMDEIIRLYWSAILAPVWLALTIHVLSLLWVHGR